MNKILTTIGAVVFLLGCSTLPQEQDQTSAQAQNGTQSKNEIWTSEGLDAEGEKTLQYRFYWFDEGVQIERIGNAFLNPETKVIERGWDVFQTAHKDGDFKQRLWFGWYSDSGKVGNVGTSTELTKDNLKLVHFVGTSTNGLMSGVIKTKYSEGGGVIDETVENFIINGTHVESTPVNTFHKLDRVTASELFDNGDIVLPKEVELFEPKLERLLGSWESKNKEGKVTLKISWNKWAMGKLLIEHFTFLNEKGEWSNGGMNVTGLDPASGRITLWSIRKNGFARSGGWDFISDDTTGQRQGNNRLIRKLEDDNTITAYWQSKKNGEYSGENGKYTLKRVVGSE